MGILDQCNNPENGDTFVAFDDVVTITALECVVQIILNLIIRVAGIAVLVMLIIGGFKYLTAGGDPKKTEEAQKTLTFAIFGLALIIISWFIILLIENFTGIPVTDFVIPR